MSPVARRPRLVAGNWKMHKTGAEGAALALEYRSILVPGVADAQSREAV